MITKTKIYIGCVGKKEGWAFSCYYNNRPYPNFKSAIYRTKKEIKQQLERYLKDGSFDTYGTAE